MKVENLSKLVVIAMFYIFAACSDVDLLEPTVDTKLYEPVINGIIGEFTDGNQVTATKAGVIEENEDYADGEKFYWMEGDRLKLLFYKDGNLQSAPTELIYKTKAPDGKSSVCEFVKESPGGLEEGKYTVYALYPADKWEYVGGVYMIKTMSYKIVQEDASSRSMGNFMYMKAKTENVDIGPTYDGNDNSFKLSFIQLASVVRFTITDPHSDSRTMKVNTIRLKVLNETLAVVPSQFFPMRAYLESLDANELTTYEDNTRVYHLTVDAGEDYPVSGNGQYTFFMPVLPTREPKSFLGLYTEWISIEGDLQFSYSKSNWELPYLDLFNASTLSFKREVAFLNEGFKAGKSYYFNLKTTNPIK